MTDEQTAALRRAASNFRRARKRADEIVRPSREALAAEIKAAYDDGMAKAEILRAIEMVWSRQWLDEILGTNPKPVKRTAQPRKRSGPASSA